MFLKDADDEYNRYKDFLIAPHEPGPQSEGIPLTKLRPMFKYVDGVERLSDLKFPFLVDLPTGSCEAVFLIASKNAGSGLVPILK